MLLLYSAEIVVYVNIEIAKTRYWQKRHRCAGANVHFITPYACSSSLWPNIYCNSLYCSYYCCDRIVHGRGFDRSLNDQYRVQHGISTAYSKFHENFDISKPVNRTQDFSGYSPTCNIGLPSKYNIIYEKSNFSEKFVIFSWKPTCAVHFR